VKFQEFVLIYNLRNCEKCNCITKRSFNY